MNLKREEFSLFNTKSKIQLIEKDGERLNLRIVFNQYFITLYSIYDFLVELVYDIKLGEIIRVDMVVNRDVLRLYDNS